MPSWTGAKWALKNLSFKDLFSLSFTWMNSWFFEGLTFYYLLSLKTVVKTKKKNISPLPLFFPPCGWLPESHEIIESNTKAKKELLLSKIFPLFVCLVTLYGGFFLPFTLKFDWVGDFSEDSCFTRKALFAFDHSNQLISILEQLPHWQFCCAKGRSILQHVFNVNIFIH